jgi:predicted RNA-binding Zn ribbon-like protein
VAVTETSDSKRAPGELALVQDFVNSVDLETGEEKLTGPDELAAWLTAHGLLSRGDQVSEGDLRRSIEAREGLRTLLVANNGGSADPAAVDGLNRAAARAAVRLAFEPTAGARLEPDAGGVDGAMARLLSAVALAGADGTWPRLKACRHETCLWAFYDRSKNRSGKWCTMESCGNVQKARAYRERNRK